MILSPLSWGKTKKNPEWVDVILVIIQIAVILSIIIYGICEYWG